MARPRAPGRAPMGDALMRPEDLERTITRIDVRHSGCHGSVLDPA